jgi:anti-sigma B factor antagonist
MESVVRSRLAEDGSAVVAVLGEIDVTNADEVCDGIRDAVTTWAPPAVLIDLRSATFIDSTGLGALIAGYRSAVECGTRFVVVNPSTRLRRVLGVTGLCELFGVDDTTRTRAADEATAI